MAIEGSHIDSPCRSNTFDASYSSIIECTGKPCLTRSSKHFHRHAKLLQINPAKSPFSSNQKTDPSLTVALNESRLLPSASVIKAAIACAAADAANKGELDLSQTQMAGDLDETFYCSILHAFDPSDALTLKNLIGLMLIVSDNPATSAVLNAVGMARVNSWLSANGLTQTHLEIGFDDASLGAPLRVNLTTAADCLKLLKLIDTDPAYGFVKRMLANNLRNERIPKRLPDEAVIAHKTGTLNGLMHDIAIIEGPEAGFYLVILADGLPETHDFANDIARLSLEIYDLMVA